uniref:Cysteine-rich repeat secretory protein 11 n=1 Tax=Lygus hesperus TaxID=30085 RepID=A0A0A9YSF5_LYGHE
MQVLNKTHGKSHSIVVNCTTSANLPTLYSSADSCSPIRSSYLDTCNITACFGLPLASGTDDLIPNYILQPHTFALDTVADSSIFAAGLCDNDGGDGVEGTPPSNSLQHALLHCAICETNIKLIHIHFVTSSIYSNFVLADSIILHVSKFGLQISSSGNTDCGIHFDSYARYLLYCKLISILLQQPLQISLFDSPPSRTACIVAATSLCFFADDNVLYDSVILSKQIHLGTGTPNTTLYLLPLVQLIQNLQDVFCTLVDHTLLPASANVAVTPVLLPIRITYGTVTGTCVATLPTFSSAVDGAGAVQQPKRNSHRLSLQHDPILAYHQLVKNVLTTASS